MYKADKRFKPTKTFEYVWQIRGDRRWRPVPVLTCGFEGIARPILDKESLKILEAILAQLKLAGKEVLSREYPNQRALLIQLG